MTRSTRRLPQGTVELLLAPVRERRLAELRGLDQLITAMEAEQAVAQVEGTGGWRPTYPWEQHVNYAEMDRAQRAAYAATAAALDQVRDAVLDALTAALAGETNPRNVVAALIRFAAAQPEPVRAAITEAVASIAGTLAGVHDDAGRALLSEAVAQGVVPPPGGRLPARLARFEPLAAAAPAWLWQRLTQAALQVGGARPAEVPQIVQAVSTTPVDGAYDLARQAVHVTHGQGRVEAASDLPEPKEVYASELLDGNTCTPCRDVDGTRYESLADAMTEYPDAGPMVNCRGGDRCRGTLVLVWDEADATS